MLIIVSIVGRCWQHVVCWPSRCPAHNWQICGFIDGNLRHRIIRTPPSTVIDEKGKIDGQTREKRAQYYSPRISKSLTSSKKKFDVGGAIRMGLCWAKNKIRSALLLLVSLLGAPLVFLFFQLSLWLREREWPFFLNYRMLWTVLCIFGHKYKWS